MDIYPLQDAGIRQDRLDGTSHHRARAAAWSIHTADRRVRALLDDVFGGLEAPHTPGAVHFDIHPTSEPGRLTLSRDGRETTHDVPHLIDHLIGFVNQEVLNRATGTVDLHASAMTNPRNGMTVVTAAPSGGGKTTIAAHLCRAGWSYLSDETVGINIRDGSLVGCGKPLTVKEGLHATLGVDLEPLTIDPALQNRWYVRPSLLGGTYAPTAPPPTDVVFVDFDPKATTTEIRDVAPPDAVLRLLTNTFRLDRNPAQVLATLARLVASARVWEVRTGDGADAVAQLLASANNRPRAIHQVLHLTASATTGAIDGPVPTPGTVFAGFAKSGAVVHDHRRSQAVVLDPIGAAIWQLLDGSVSVSVLATELAEHFEMPVGAITSDIQALCNDLTQRGFLTPA